MVFLIFIFFFALEFKIFGLVRARTADTELQAVNAATRPLAECLQASRPEKDLVCNPQAAEQAETPTFTFTRNLYPHLPCSTHILTQITLEL